MGLDDLDSRRFNPCFRGTRSRTRKKGALPKLLSVSILVFVELALGLYTVLCFSVPVSVSILVFVELALGHSPFPGCFPLRSCFNPCFRGTRSRTTDNSRSDIAITCFNPCFRGTRSRTLCFQTRVILFSGFNPCFRGTRSRTSVLSFGPLARLMFQSLFSWNSLSDCPIKLESVTQM